MSTTPRKLSRGRYVKPEELQQMARHTMAAHFSILKRRGNARAARSPEQFYGFTAEQVVEIYFRKHGVGRGVWYRLNDGRVIDALARPSQPERIWYVAASH